MAKKRARRKPAASSLPGKPKVRPGAKPPSPVWDLYTDGLSYSLMTRFVACRERFRLRVVEGLDSTEFSVPMEWGNLFHTCLEHHTESDAMLHKRLTKYAEKFIQSRSLTAGGATTFYSMVEVVMLYWPKYQEYWKPLDSRISFIAPEEKFKVPYTIKPYATVPLRGKIDGVINHEGEPWLMEHKTKTSFPNNILDTLPHNMQTMMYSMVCKLRFGMDIKGVMWNGIKRPTIKQTKADGSLTGYLKRLGNDIDDRPEWYFMRCECRFSEGDIERWRTHTFNPLLVAIIEWWESIKKNPREPWHREIINPEYIAATPAEREDGDIAEIIQVPNPMHYERPVGVYDPMSHGLDSYFEYLMQNKNSALSYCPEVFPELTEE